MYEKVKEENEKKKNRCTDKEREKKNMDMIKKDKHRKKCTENRR